MKRINGISGTIIVIAIVGVAGLAFAHGGGYGYGMMGPGMMGNGYGYGMMGPGMMDQGGYYGNHMGDDGYGRLTREQADRLEKARDSFYDSTRQLRHDIRDKQFALNDELDKAGPDAAKVIQLQKDLSQLRSEFDQKALAYRLETRKILPESDGDRDFHGYVGCAW